MIRKFAHFRTAPEKLAELLGDVERWGEWMHGVERVTGVETGGGDTRRRVVTLDQRFLGRSFTATVELLSRPHELRQRQLEGLLERWEVVWSFRPGPEDMGTTVTVEVDYALGMLRFLTSRRAFEARARAELERVLESLAQRVAASERAEEAPHEPGGEPGDPTGATAERDGEVLFRLYETPRGLEAELEGRCYRLVPIDRDRSSATSHE